VDASGQAPPTKVLYVASSPYSGSTLLAFLLNGHPDIFTVGELDGWNYAEGAAFRCSCGSPIQQCPFFATIAGAIRREGLPFEFREFGTRYRLAHARWLNRYLTKHLPLVRSSALERLRDGLVLRVPRLAATLRQQDRANRAFIRAALAYSGATVFVDACKDPFRLRHLRRIQDLDLRVVHLVRDPRGVVASNMSKRGWGASRATRKWMLDQLNIVRVAREVGPVLTVHYEDLCDRVDAALADVHRFLDLPAEPFGGDLGAAEHHILGNVMRHRSREGIVKDTRWEQNLSASDLDTITRILLGFVRRRRSHPAADLVMRYVAARP
jgi:hypothetical protein